MTRPVDIKELVAQLTARIEALCAELLPGGRMDRRYCQVGSLAGEPGQSLAVNLQGAWRGRWKDYATGEFGDALDLVAQVLFTGDKRQAVQWAIQWLGHDSCQPSAVSHQHRPARAPANDPEQAETDRKKAHGIWLAARPLVEGDPVCRYLAGRGIDVGALPKVPGAIRYHPDLFHRSLGSGRGCAGMVTAIADQHGRFLAVHRTWLKILPDGAVAKADLKPNKMVWPGYAGGFIRLNRGQSGKPMTRAPEGEALWIVEGVEDGLTAALAAPECRIVAAVSLSNLGNLAGLSFKRFDLLLQNDTKPETLAARRRAIVRLQEAGHEVWLHFPPGDVKDINDLARRAQGGAA